MRETLQGDLEGEYWWVGRGFEIDPLELCNEDRAVRACEEGGMVAERQVYPVMTHLERVIYER